MSKDNKRIEPPRMTRNEIHRVIREQILTCAIPPGAELREQELAQQFNVSKSPIREALQDLVREQLILVIPRQGYRVAPISLTDAREMFALRRVLELASAAEAAKNASDEELAELDRFRTFSGKKEDDFIAYNEAFHSALARCSGNERMSRMTCELIEGMNRLVRMSVSAVRGRDPQKLVDEHAQIIDALQTRNEKQAVTLLKAHTLSAEKRFINALEWSAVQG